MDAELLPKGSKVVIYRRKSLESEDRQVVSLERQRQEIYDRIITPNKLQVLKDFSEKKSAKAPGRPIFDEMMEFVQQNDVKLIVCFALNRLARNPVDAGKLSWIVQNSDVRLVTTNKVYTASDNILTQMEFVVSNQFILDLRKHTISGLQKKLESGQAPIHAPVGYLNNMKATQGMRNILPDPDRFDLVRRMWDMLLSKQYLPSEILHVATKEWGLTTKPATDASGQVKTAKLLSRSQMYEMFHNLFYTGKFEYSGQVYKGNHKPMITMGEYEEAQRILGGKNNRRPRFCEFSYTGMIRCECGGMVTAHERHRFICPACKCKYNALTNTQCPKCKTKAPEKKWYGCLYHCSQKSIKGGCRTQSIKLRDLEEQIDGILETMNIDPDFLSWGLSKLRQNVSDEQELRNESVKNHTRQLQDKERQETILKDRFFSSDNEDNSLLTTEEFKQRREELIFNRTQIEATLAANSQTHDSSVETIADAYDFVKKARYWLKHGSIQERRLILTTVSSNPKLIEGKILADLKKEYDCLQKGKDICEQTINMFEPDKKTDGTVEYGDWMLKNPTMGGTPDSNRRPSPPQGDALTN